MVAGIGCADPPSGMTREAYFRKLQLLEIGATTTRPPRPSVLEKWRNEAPPHAIFTMNAWRILTDEPTTEDMKRLAVSPADPADHPGLLRVNQAAHLAWTQVHAAAKALAAEAIVFRTPPSFFPTQSNRERLRRFFTELVVAPDTVIVWEPQGMWEVEVAARLATDLGLVLAYDPLQLEEPAPVIASAYLRIRGMGLHRGRLTDQRFDKILTAASQHSQVWIVLATAERYRDAVRLRELLQESASNDQPGTCI
ncbi:MAG: DUF72 domain-containing protein [Pseudomonadota bacterium]